MDMTGKKNEKFILKGRCSLSKETQYALVLCVIVIHTMAKPRICGNMLCYSRFCMLLDGQSL
jgi:hypothetical protein